MQQRAGFPPTSHEAREVDHIIETYPRDELFQASTEELVDVVTQLLALEQRPRLRWGEAEIGGVRVSSPTGR